MFANCVVGKSGFRMQNPGLTSAYFASFAVPPAHGQHSAERTSASHSAAAGKRCGRQCAFWPRQHAKGHCGSLPASGRARTESRARSAI